MPKKKQHPKVKSELHPRNKHRERYDFKKLIKSCPELAPFVKRNDYDDESIDFFNPEAVKALNKSLLIHFYNIEKWEIPEGYLCPPIPGRADYIHYAADLLSHNGEIPKEKNIRCLDIGTGANCVYPIIGNRTYDWDFVGTDIDPKSIQSAKNIVNSNPVLKKNIELRLQKNANNIFHGVIQQEERFDLTFCNPPFHSSQAEAQSGTIRKLRNLKRKKGVKPMLNFGGQNNELWCKGGELAFVQNMIRESKEFSNSVLWFTTLVSKQEHLKMIYKTLEDVETLEMKTIPMGQGNKISRMVAWTFLTKEEKQLWFKS